MTKIMIILQDGIVQNVYSNQMGIELRIIDYDTDRFLEEDTKSINGEDVYIYKVNEPCFDNQLVEDTFKEIDDAAAQECMHGVYVREDGVTIYDRGEEVIRWTADQIEQNPMVAMSVANALNIYYTDGMDHLKQSIGRF